MHIHDIEVNLLISRKLYSNITLDVVDKTAKIYLMVHNPLLLPAELIKDNLKKDDLT
jgi:hypothetical protein